MTDNTTDDEQNEDTGLKAKNAELLKKLNAQKAENKTLADKFAELEERFNDTADTSKSEIEKERNRFERDLQKLKEANDALTANLSTLKIDGAVNEAIAKNGVLPQHVRAVTLMLKDGAKMDDGEALVNGVPLTDHISTFFSGDDAKHYVAAPANTGGGAKGSSTVATSGEPIKNLTEAMKLKSENPSAFATANLDPALSFLKRA